MPESFAMRVLTAADAPVLWEFRKTALQMQPEAFGEAVEEHLDTTVDAMAARLRSGGEESFVVGAFAGEALVGMAGFYRESRKKRRHRGWVWGMYVAADWRGHGIGRGLLQELIGLASALPGLRRILLSVSVTQSAARRLYESSGFQAYGTEPEALAADGRFLDEIHMSLKVDRALPGGA